MTKKGTKLIGIIFKERHLEMIRDLAEQTGQENKSEIVRTALFYYYTKVMKDFSVVRKAEAKPRPSVEEEIRGDLKRKEVLKKIRGEEALLEAQRISKLLDGELFEESGFMYCRFKCYEYMNPTHVHEGWMTFPIEELSDNLVDLKWKGGREKIEEVLAKNK